MNRIDPTLLQRFSDWQRGLTVIRRSNQDSSEIAVRQQSMIAAVRGGPDSFVSYMCNALKTDVTNVIDAPDLPRQLIASEFRDPPFLLEKSLGESWQGLIARREAANPMFWTLCHMNWISNGRLGSNLSGALTGSLVNGADETSTERAARNLLRRLGGLPHVRGKISVLSDCPLSRAWWRGQISQLAAQSSFGELECEEAHRVLHSNNDAWERLVLDSIQRVTVVSHPRVRAALISQYRSASREVTRVPAREMQEAVRMLAQHGPTLAFDCLDWTELKALVSDSVMHIRVGAGQAKLNRTTENGSAQGSKENEIGSGGFAGRISKLFKR